MAETPTITIERFISGSWDNISSYVVSNLTGQLGMLGDEYDDRVASTGTLFFTVNNASGDLTPNDNFKRGTPIRVRVNWQGNVKTAFSGRIKDIDVDAGTWGDRQARVYCEDWMGYARAQTIRLLPAEDDVRIDEAAQSLVDLVSVQPDATDYDTDGDDFTTVFDNADPGVTVLSELNSLALSDLGYVYLKDGGATLAVESRYARNGLRGIESYEYKLPATSPGFLLKTDGDYLLKTDGGKIALSDADHFSAEASLGLKYQDIVLNHGKNLLNEVYITVYPRLLGSTAINVFDFDITNGTEPILIPALGSYTLKGNFTGPVHGQPITAYDVVIPVVTTDYLFNSKADGTGTNLSANLSISFSSGAKSFESVITNTGAQGYLIKHRVRGKAIYKFNPIELLKESIPSKGEHGTSTLYLRQLYQQTPALGLIEAEKILDDEKEPRMKITRLKFLANTSAALMAAFMFIDLGALINVTSTKPTIDRDLYVQGMTYDISLGGTINYEYIVKETYSLSKGLEPLGVRFSGFSGSENAILFGRPPHLADLAQKTYAGWVYMRSGASTAPLMSKNSATGGDVFFLYNIAPNGDRLMYQRFFTTSYGEWRTTDAVLAGLADQWIHIAVTHDASSASNDPIFYVNGVAVAVTEVNTPSGTVISDADAPFMVGNVRYVSFDLFYNLNAYLKDLRVYNRVLSADEIAELADNENDYTTVPDGLVFQGIGVKTEQRDDYLDNPILPEMKLIDNIYGIRGTATFDTSNADFQMKGADPEDTTLP